MLTAMYSLGHVVGAEIWVLGMLVCALLYMGVCCLFRKNRNRRGLKRILLGLLTAEVICDGTWAAVFYHGGAYHNYGIGAACGLLLWPGLLFFTGLVVTMINTKE